MNFTETDAKITLSCYEIVMSMDIKDSDRRTIALLHKKMEDALKASGGIKDEV